MLSLQQDDINNFDRAAADRSGRFYGKKTGTVTKPEMFDAPGGDDKHLGVRSWDAIFR
jgi:hypothetical protein